MLAGNYVAKCPFLRLCLACLAENNRGKGFDVLAKFPDLKIALPFPYSFLQSFIRLKRGIKGKFALPKKGTLSRCKKDLLVGTRATRLTQSLRTHLKIFSITY